MEQEFLRSLFCDGTESYVSPMEPAPYGRVTVRFRAQKDAADGIFLISEGRTTRMLKAGSDSLFDYYETELQLAEDAVSYFFLIAARGEHCIYDRLGVSFDRACRKPFTIVPGFSTPDWAKGAVMYQIFTDRFCNGDPDNDVLDGEYAYLGAPVHRVRDWGKLPEADDVRNFYGGDLQGIWDKLDYLQDLGVEVLYLNPIFVSPSNHKYDTQDYDSVDPHFGLLVADEGELLPEGETDNRKAARYRCRVTDARNLEGSNAFFARFVKEVHRRGMRVILDGVFNHCGSFNKWMDKEQIYEGQSGYEPGAYVSKDSPYHSFFSFADENAWPCNDSYQGWWGYDTLPKLNYESAKKLEKYILEIGVKWVSPPYNVDGWRLDVAADLGFSPEYNHRFWKKFRKAVKEANPDAVILAEHYGDASAWLCGDEWDTVMNYDAFMEPLTWFFTGEDKHSDQYRDDLRCDAQTFQSSMTQAMAAYLTPSLLTAMNELSNHDHSRFLTRTSGRPGRVATNGSVAASEGIRPEIMREAVVMQMTWPGAPTIYYGDEAGLCGYTDPDNRRTYPWGKEDQEMIRFHKSAIALHRAHPVLKYGSVLFLSVWEAAKAPERELHSDTQGIPADGDGQGAPRGCLAYARFDEKEQIVVLFNNSDSAYNLAVDVTPAGITDTMSLTRIFMTDAAGYTEKMEAENVENGTVKVCLPAVSSVVMEAQSKGDTILNKKGS